MKRILLFLTLSCLFSAFALADASHASLQPVKHRDRHHPTRHHAHRATKHHAQHRHHHSV